MQRQPGLDIATGERDLVVVGAGPAGCSAALFAARGGFDVLLVDRATFPRDKVCGDGITPAAQLVLGRMGVLAAVERASSWRTTRLVAHSPGGAVMDGRSPRVAGMPEHALVLRRLELDRLLLEHVVAQKISVMQGCDIDRVVVEDGRVRGVEGICAGRSVGIRAKYVVAADGAHSKIAGQLSLRNRKPKHRALGIRAYFENVDGLDDSCELHYRADLIPAYGWVFPIGKRSANIGLGLLCAARQGQSIKALFQRFLSDAPSVRSRLKRAHMVDDSCRGWPLPLGSYSGRRSAANVLLTGDAGSLVDPLSGEGIFQALRSGELAAEALTSLAQQRQSPDQLGSVYEKLWRREFLWSDVIPGYLVQRLLHRSWIIEHSIRRAARSEQRAILVAGAMAHLYPKSRLLLNW